MKAIVDEERQHLYPIDILFVEDNEADIKVTLRAFEKAKIKNNIFVVNDGQEAMDFVFHQGKYTDKQKYPRPDLILLDINMPKLNGFQVLEKIKAEEELKMIPVVMLTSSRSEQDIAKSYKGGAASYIEKPVDYKDFVKTVEGFNFYWHIVNRIPDGKRPRD